MFNINDTVVSTNAKDSWRSYGVGTIIDLSGNYNLNSEYTVAVAFSNPTQILYFKDNGEAVFVSAFYTEDGQGADGDTLSLYTS